MISEAALDFDTVDVRDVSRHFGRRRALARVTLTCRSGDIIGLLGPNGAGKSTLLGVLSTLVRPTSGDVRYGGRLASEMGDVLRGRVGMLGHDVYLYGDLTARENLEFFGRLYGVRDLRTAVDTALRHARLQDRAGDRVAGFSRGLRQRLALERALLHQPRLVLLDEPFTGLDDESGSVLVERLQLLRAQGAIVVMATHDFESAERLVTSAVCLDSGRLKAIEPGEGSLRERYRETIGRSVGRVIGPLGDRAIGSSGQVIERSGDRVIGPSIAAASAVPVAAARAPQRPPSVIAAAWLVARKDLVVEARSRELVYTTVFFALTCVLVFAFGFVREQGRPVEDAAAGILWVALVFSGTLALGRAFERERQSETLRALLLAPVERASVYLGKLLALLALMTGVELVIVPVVALLFGAPIARAPWLLAALVAAGTLGFAAVGTIFAAMLVRAQSRDVLLPVLLYPIAVPIVIGGVRGTAAIFGAEPNLAVAQAWLSMLVFFDAVFLTLALWTFAPVMSE